MTKIYLVSFVDKKEGYTWSNEAFTNLRKAKAYQRYWEAVIRTDPSWYGNLTKLEMLEINNRDYTDIAIKKETEELPY